VCDRQSNGNGKNRKSTSLDNITERQRDRERMKERARKLKRE